MVLPEWSQSKRWFELFIYVISLRTCDKGTEHPIVQDGSGMVEDMEKAFCKQGINFLMFHIFLRQLLLYASRVF